MMKRICLALLVLMMVSCQEEELTVVEEQQDSENIASMDAELRALVQSVTSHDGSHDDIVDKASCFSINFPYEVFYNGEPYQINSIADLAPFNEDDEIIPVFPITVTYANYESRDFANYFDFLAEVDRCNAEQLFNDTVTCIDIVYPMSLALYDVENSDFTTLVLDHDKLTFESLEYIPDGIIVSINYPMEVVWENGAVVRLTRNDDLKTEIFTAAEFCN